MSNNLNTSEIYNNAAALQTLLHALCKSVSHTDEEFNLKYDRLMRTYNRWGYGAQMTTFGSLTYYCLKANGVKSKLTFGFLYIYWINHFFTVGSFIGVTFSLPWAMRHLQQVDQKSNLYQQLTQIQNLIRNRKDESDSELNNMFYALRVINNEKVQDQKRTQLVENDFFDKHPEYVPQVMQENLRLPYLDYFLVRFAYFTFTRWITRVGQFAGIIQ
ncbi:unnamed protein product [Paramecium pentaurelia]|uniref:Uncharacterized protein n=1 Tax=Paramecium pentaurelia TaxID=43138 RepID=A0A8S1W384_9CILI|nr:unnamed protein product [Paramecium pentaurelia]